MLSYAWIFLVIAIIAAIFGFGGIAVASAGIAKILFFIFLAVFVISLLMGRRSLSGSLIGGIAETQEMLDFCGKHGIVSDVEVIPMQKINEAYERLLKSDVKYRFSIDMASLKGA